MLCVKWECHMWITYLDMNVRFSQPCLTWQLPLPISWWSAISQAPGNSCTFTMTPLKPPLALHTIYSDLQLTLCQRNIWLLWPVIWDICIFKPLVHTLTLVEVMQEFATSVGNIFDSSFVLICHGIFDVWFVSSFDIEDHCSIILRTTCTLSWQWNPSVKTTLKVRHKRP